MPLPKNPVRFRAQLDQVDATLNSKLAKIPTEVIAQTFVEIHKPVKHRGDAMESFDFIRKCGPAMVGMAVMAVLRTLANELCRRGEESEV